MKSVVRSVMLTVAVSIALTAAAQQPMPRKTPEERAQNQVKWMQKNIGLTDDQGSKVYNIMLRTTQDMENNKEEPRGRQKKHERMGIQAEKEDELRAVLTGEQFDRYQAHVQEMKQRAQERKANMQQSGY